MFLDAEERRSVTNHPLAERPHSHRIWELDFLRGFTILLMCIDHFMFDLSAMFSDVWAAKGGAAAAIAKFACMWWDHGLSWVGATRDVIQVIAISVFFGLCGGSTIFSRDNLTRAMKTLLAACVITIGTYFLISWEVLDEGDLIIFGVLHMLSLATLLVAGVYALTRLAGKKSDLVFVVVSALLAGAIFLVNQRLNGLEPIENGWLMPLHESFSRGLDMGDYFPLIPNLGIAFAGAAVITLVYGRGKSLLPKLDGAWNKPFRFVGRHTLLVVILHQVVNVLLLALVTAAFVDRGNFVLF
ncbi:MAG: DUF1624 domain-containing protein [Clostridia bacterium]|nr:DUF1624 domain-containing protein [Clostridia bacterium]